MKKFLFFSPLYTKMHKKPAKTHLRALWRGTDSRRFAFEKEYNSVTILLLTQIFPHQNL